MALSADQRPVFHIAIRRMDVGLHLREAADQFPVVVAAILVVAVDDDNRRPHIVADQFWLGQRLSHRPAGFRMHMRLFAAEQLVGQRNRRENQRIDRREHHDRREAEHHLMSDLPLLAGG